MGSAGKHDQLKESVVYFHWILQPKNTWGLPFLLNLGGMDAREKIGPLDNNCSSAPK